MDLISVEASQGLAFEVSIRNHSFTCDMAPHEEGSDLGPSPSEYLVASLGSCVGVLIARYCRTIGCSTRGLALYLTFQMEDRPKRVSNIVVDVELPEDFPEERKGAIQRLLDSCPVHGTLTHPPEIDIELT